MFCTLCNLVRCSGNFKRKGSISSTSKKQERNCGKCLKTKGKGKKHTCEDGVSVYNNIKYQINNDLTYKQKEHLLCELVKETSRSKMIDKSQHEVSLPQARGKSLRIALNLKQRNEKQISASDMVKIQTHWYLSSNQIHGIASDMRVGVRSRKLLNQL